MHVCARLDRTHIYMAVLINILRPATIDKSCIFEEEMSYILNAVVH